MLRQGAVTAARKGTSMDNDPVVIVGAARTPMGGLSVRRSLCSLDVVPDDAGDESAHAEAARLARD